MNGNWQPSGAVAPGLREPWGPSGGFFAWGEFTPRDLEACYPMPRWVAERIARYPQRSVGNALRDPLPVPFTAEEVRHALVEIGRLPPSRPARVCARVDPASVNIALRVLPIVTSRNGGWIDLDAGRREEPYRNRPAEPRTGVFHLGCALARLPGKPLPHVYAGMCEGTQPKLVASLLNVMDVETTLVRLSDPPRSGGAFAGDSSSPTQHGSWVLASHGTPTLGYFLDRIGDAKRGPQPFSSFEIRQAYGIKGES